TFLYIPALLETEDEFESTRRSEPYISIDSAWAGMDQAIVSISNYPTYPDTGVKSIYGNRLMEQHAVGRVLAYYFDIGGNIIKANEDTVTQASMNHLNHTELIALCSRQVRPEAVIGALRLGVINTLYIPFGLAEAIVSALSI
ncbi:MAG: hypothetical protein IJM62_07360, partial [Lachnospiraceae bacterium]|nr:hypothetical protein [Lachnospiraceae bacterium]